MALKQNTFEGGTNATSVTTGNSGGGSGDAFTLVASTGSATRTYSTAQAAHGAQSALLSATAGGETVQFVYGGYTATSIATRAYFRLSALPAGNTVLIFVYPSSGSPVASVYLDATGKLFVQDLGGTKFTMVSSLSLNTWYRIELVTTRGTTATDGALNFAVYSLDSTTPVASYSASNLNTGTSAVTLANVQLGLPGGAVGGAYSLHMDTVAADDGATAFIGPYAVANSAPTVNVGADQTGVEPWAPVSLTATASDPDGTTPTVTWAQSAGSPAVTLSGSGATRTFTAPGTLAGATLTFTATASDGSLSASDSVTVAVLPVTERAVIGGVEVPMRVRTT